MILSFIGKPLFCICLFWLLLSCSFMYSQTSGKIVDDRDGKEYKTVVIGKQTWMAQNLNYETETSWCYKDSFDYCKKVGRLYLWDEAQNVCPDEWHLPTKQDIDTLIIYLGGKWKAGGKLKEKGTKYWEWPNKGATNESNFNALPTDIRLLTGGYIGLLRSNAEFWTATEINEVAAHSLKLYSSITLAEIAKAYKTTALSIRCIKNE